MTRLARILLTALLVPVASCGFNETQKTAFVHRITEAILNATDTPSAILVRSAVAAPPARITAPAARPLVCEKRESRTRCPRSSPHQSRATVAARPLFEPVYIPLDVQIARLRLSAQREAAARIHCEIASMREARRHSSVDEETRFFIRTQFATASDAIVPLPPSDGVAISDDMDFVFETIGG